MPHLVKNMNSLENRGTKPTWNLMKGGKRLSLLMLQIVWECSQGTFGEIKTKRNTLKYYQKMLTVICKYGWHIK